MIETPNVMSSTKFSITLDHALEFLEKDSVISVESPVYNTLAPSQYQYTLWAGFDNDYCVAKLENTVTDSCYQSSSKLETTFNKLFTQEITAQSLVFTLFGYTPPFPSQNCDFKVRIISTSGFQYLQANWCMTPSGL